MPTQIIIIIGILALWLAAVSWPKPRKENFYSSHASAYEDINETFDNYDQEYGGGHSDIQAERKDSDSQEGGEYPEDKSSQMDSDSQTDSDAEGTKEPFVGAYSVDDKDLYFSVIDKETGNYLCPSGPKPKSLIVLKDRSQINDIKLVQWYLDINNRLRNKKNNLIVTPNMDGHLILDESSSKNEFVWKFNPEDQLYFINTRNYINFLGKKSTQKGDIAVFGPPQRDALWEITTEQIEEFACGRDSTCCPEQKTINDFDVTTHPDFAKYLNQFRKAKEALEKKIACCQKEKQDMQNTPNCVTQKLKRCEKKLGKCKDDLKGCCSKMNSISQLADAEDGVCCAGNKEGFSCDCAKEPDLSSITSKFMPKEDCIAKNKTELCKICTEYSKKLPIDQHPEFDKYMLKDDCVVKDKKELCKILDAYLKKIPIEKHPKYAELMEKYACKSCGDGCTSTYIPCPKDIKDHPGYKCLMDKYAMKNGDAYVPCECPKCPTPDELCPKNSCNQCNGN